MAGRDSRSASQASEREQMTTERSGHTSPKLFAVFDHESSSWRTSRPSLPLENSPEPSLRWPHSGMWDLGGAYELPKQELRTSARGSSSSPSTPATSGDTGAGPAVLLPTPLTVPESKASH